MWWIVLGVVVLGLWWAAEAVLRWADDQDVRDECERREDEEWRG